MSTGIEKGKEPQTQSDSADRTLTNLARGLMSFWRKMHCRKAGAKATIVLSLGFAVALSAFSKTMSWNSVGACVTDAAGWKDFYEYVSYHNNLGDHDADSSFNHAITWFRQGEECTLGGFASVSFGSNTIEDSKYTWELPTNAGLYRHVYRRNADPVYHISHSFYPFIVLQSLGPSDYAYSHELRLKVEAEGYTKLSKSIEFDVGSPLISTWEAVDINASALDLQKSGTSYYGWFGEGLISADGADAAQSGLCDKGETSSMQAWTKWPCRIRFKWLKVGDDGDTLKFYAGQTGEKLLETCSAQQTWMNSVSESSLRAYADILGLVFASSRDYILGTNGYHHTHAPEKLKWEFKRGNSDLNLNEMHSGFVDQVEITRLREVHFRSHGGSLVDWIWAIPGEEVGKIMNFPESGPKRAPSNACGDSDAYVFEGWFTDTETIFDDDRSGPRTNGRGTQVFASSIVPAGTDPITLHARWRLVKPNRCYDGPVSPGGGDDRPAATNSLCTVMLNANEGMVSPDRRYVEKGSPIGYLPDAERDGWQFAGWWTSASGGTRINGSTIVNGNVTYYAHWDKEPEGGVYHKVVFEPNGGVVNETSRIVGHGIAIGTMPTPAKTGFTFKGWFTSASGGTQVTSATTINADMTLYAHWIDNAYLQYAIRYHKNDGSYEVTREQTAPCGASVQLLSLKDRLGWERTGFVFKGWATSKANADAGNVRFADSSYVKDGASGGGVLDVWAAWDVAPGYYAIKFNKNDGSGAWRTVAFQYGKSKALPSCAKGLGWTRSGYAFVGWAVSAEKANAPGVPANIWRADQAIVSTPVAAGSMLDVYASWVAGYVVRFHKNTGETPEIIKIQGIQSGVRTRLAAVKNGLGWTRTGFVFKGWATSKANADAKKIWKGDWSYVNDGTSAGKTLDVWAVWDVAPGYYAIKFNKNDGSGAWRTIAFPYGKARALPTCVDGLGWTRSGYAFVGWAVSAAKANAPGVPANIWRTDQALVSTPVAAGKMLEVYASWVKGYTVRYHKNTGETPEVIKTQGIQTGVKTRLAAVKNGLGWTRTGFVFKGWATSKANAEAEKIWKGDWSYVKDGTSAGKTLDVWAVWGVAPGYYALRFNKNDGSGSWRTVAFQYGKASVLPSCAKGLGWTRSGNAFVGWAVSAAKANAPGVPANIWRPDQALVSTPVAAGKMMDVYASWVKGYTVRYHKNTGETPEVIKTQGIQTGVKTRLAALKNGLGWTRTGFAFKGWATSLDNAVAGKIWKGDWSYVKDGMSAGKTLDVWAVWEIAPGYYVIRFNKNDGSGTWREVAFPYGKSRPLPTCADGLGWSRGNSAFVGWSISEARANAPDVPANIWRTDQAYVSTPVGSGNVLNVYASWVKGYTVRFHKNTGETPEVVKTQGIRTGVKTRLAAVKNGLGWTRTGFAFKGWATSPANAKAGKIWKGDWSYVKDGTSAGKTLDVWAVWDVEPGYYALRFNKNDGSGEWRTVAFPHGKTRSLPTCADGLGWRRGNFAFVGWAVSAAKANAPGVPANIWKTDQALVSTPVAAGKMMDVYASWVKGYTVRFHKNTGETPEVIKTQGIQTGVKTRLAAVKNGLGWTRTGFVFKGWATSPANAEAKKIWKGDWSYVKDGTSAGKTLDVWAVWGVAPGYYVIRFNKNDGSGASRAVAFQHGQSMTLPTCASGLGWSRGGFAFVGWSVSEAKAAAPGVPANIWKPDQGVVSAPVSAGSVLDVYAAWVKGYAIRFHKNTGVTPEIIKAQGIQSGVRTRLAALKNGLGWERNGFVFRGWATSMANAKARKVWKGDWSYVMDATSLGKVLNVWAIWEGTYDGSNDNFANARTISGSSGSATASNKGATSESNEPLVRNYPYAKNSIWWTWTAPSSGTVTFSTSGTEFDTVMGVYTGSSLSGLGTVAEDDDKGGNSTSTCVFSARAKTVYYIAVAGYNVNYFGTIRLSWAMASSNVVMPQMTPTKAEESHCRVNGDGDTIFLSGVLPDDSGVYCLVFNRITGEGSVCLERGDDLVMFDCMVGCVEGEEGKFVVMLENGEVLLL